MKTFYNGKKIPLIPPLLINDKLESNFGKNANHFNEFFASKCTLLNNGSTLPHSLSNTPTVELSSFQFNDQDIYFFLYIYNIQFTQKNKITITRYLKWVYLGIK